MHAQRGKYFLSSHCRIQTSKNRSLYESRAFKKWMPVKSFFCPVFKISWVCHRQYFKLLSHEIYLFLTVIFICFGPLFHLLRNWVHHRWKDNFQCVFVGCRGETFKQTTHFIHINSKFTTRGKALFCIMVLCHVAHSEPLNPYLRTNSQARK